MAYLMRVTGLILTISVVLNAGSVFGQAASTSSGQVYPSKPVRILTAEPGGGSDLVGRLVAQGLTGALGQPVIVDNRVGIFPAEVASRASPDGYTLLLNGSIIWIAPLLRAKPPYDPVRDFSPVILIASTPNLLVIHTSLAANTVKDLIALAKAKPGELNYSSAAAGSSNHLGAELFRTMAGVNIVRVTYKGAGPALNAIIAGEAQIMFPAAATATPHVKSGRVKALAVTSLKPSVLAPGMPTLAASGLPGYESVQIYGALAPAKTPVNIVERLNQETARVISRQEVKDRLLAAGLETVGGSPQAYASTIKSDLAKWAKLIKDVGIREE